MGRRGKKGLENKCTQDKERKENEKAKERPPTASFCPTSNLQPGFCDGKMPVLRRLPPTSSHRKAAGG